MPPNVTETMLRLGMAVLTGIVLGLERESHGRAAGLRTTVLVCVAATLAALLSEQFYVSSFTGNYPSAGWHPDPARLAAGILTGIGFLGAGVIVRQGNLVRGVTTASQIWFVTILGLCYGSGQILLGFLGLLISISTLLLLRYVEAWVVEAWVKNDWYATLSLTLTAEGPSLTQISEIISQLGMKAKNLELAYDVANKLRTLTYSLRFKKRDLLELPNEVVSRLAQLPGVLRVDWR
jgi:putative Mg2+ transporter-C (MgtC) family protein